MKKKILLAGIILLGLVGLVAVQVRLLWLGIQLELNRFEQQTNQALRQFQSDFFDDVSLEKSLGEALINVHLPSNDSTKLGLVEALENKLKKRLSEHHVTTDISIAITDASSLWVLMHGVSFDANRFRFDVFRLYLGNTIKENSNRACYLHVHINHLFAFLLQQLYYLVLPSVLFLVLLFVGFGLLFRYLNQWQQLDRFKNDFINHLTHELNNPVFAISMSSNLLKQHPEQMNTYLPFIEKETQKLKTYIEKVLELASFEQSHYHLKYEKVFVQQLIQETVEPYQLILASSGTAIQFDFQATDRALWLDRLHFANCLNNLVENAIKYNDKIPSITISTRSKQKTFYIQIKDNGIGIPKAAQRYIFDKFYRVSNKHNQTVKGFGLGLSYVNQIIKAHGGKITVESELEKHTIFNIQLPIS
jgi:two-component system phosphate regulon sensor histidine kinase PhoR